MATVGIDIYESIEDTDEWAATQLSASEWLAMSDTIKEQVALAATLRLDTWCDNWKLMPHDADQALAFPRGTDEAVPADILLAYRELCKRIAYFGTDDITVSEPQLVGLKADVVQLDWAPLISGSTTKSIFSALCVQMLSVWCDSDNDYLVRT